MDTPIVNAAKAGGRFEEDEYPSQRLTGIIISSAFVVFHEFGYGLSESVYRRSLVVELRYRGVPVAEEVSGRYSALSAIQRDLRPAVDSRITRSPESVDAEATNAFAPCLTHSAAACPHG